MRRMVTWTFGVALVTALVIFLSAVLLTNSALATANSGPAALCLAESNAAELAAGTLSNAKKDRIAALNANFALGPRGGLWWHLRGSTIALAYRAFWSEEERSAIFARVIAKTRRCRTP